MEVDFLRLQLKNLIVVNVYAALVLCTYSSMPVFLGAYVDELGFTLQEAGRVAAGETVGAALGTALVTLYVVKSGRALRRILFVALIALLISQLGSATFHSVLGLGSSRLLSGIASGTIFTLGAAYIGSTDRPDRPFSILYGLSFLMGGIGLLAFPTLIVNHGLNSIYLSYALVAGVSLFFVSLYPVQAEQLERHELASEARREAMPSLAIVSMLAAIGLNFVFNGGLWIYIERIAVASDLGGPRLGFVLAVGLLCGLFGTLLVNLLGDRIGRLIPLVGAHLSLLLATYLLYISTSEPLFLFGLGVFNASLTVLTPYVLSSLASWDPSGRSPVIGTLAYTAGYGVGPGVLSFMIGGDGFFLAFAISGAFFVCSLLLILLSYGLVHRNSHGVLVD